MLSSRVLDALILSYKIISVAPFAERSGKEFSVGVSLKIKSERWTDKYDETDSQEYKNLTEKILLEVGIFIVAVVLNYALLGGIRNMEEGGGGGEKSK